MDTTTQWPQGIVVKPIEEIVTINTNPNPSSNLERNNKVARPHLQKESAALNCPRCNSTNTKFCYYNNYSLTQPRYFCKSCRRYWTNGGSLRNIPVGGGSRKKHKRPSSTPSSNLSNSNLTKSRLPDLVQPQSQDLELGFPSNQVFTHDHQEKNNSLSTSTTTTTTSTSHQLSAMNSFNNGGVYTPSFPMSELMMKPTLNFSLDGIGSGYESGLEAHHVQENNGRLLFPFEDLKKNKEQHHGNGDSSGYWTGMLGGGSW